MEAQEARLELPAASCWTGRVAAWAPFPSLQQQQQSAGGLLPLKTAAKGLWLRSEQGGVLMVRCSGGSTPPLLTFTLRSAQQLVQAPLTPGGFSFRLLCPEHGAPQPTAGGSSGHVLFLAVGPGPSCWAGGGGASPPRAPPGRLFAIHFDTIQAGLECGALLQAIQSGSVALLMPQTLQAAAPPAAAAAAAAAGGRGASLSAPQQREGPAAAPEEQQQAGAEEQKRDASLFGYEDEASLMEAMQVKNRRGKACSVGADRLRWLAGPCCISGLLRALFECTYQALCTAT